MEYVCIYIWSRYIRIWSRYIRIGKRIISFGSKICPSFLEINLSLEVHGFITVRFSYRNCLKVEVKLHTLKQHHPMLRSFHLAPTWLANIFMSILVPISGPGSVLALPLLQIASIK